MSEQLKTCNRNSVLIVDDEHAVRRAFKRVFEIMMPDYEISLAENGQEAVGSFFEKRQGAIVMDLNMPVMDGEEAFEEIMSQCEVKNFEKPAVIFCTGYAPSTELMQLVSDSDLHELLEKPVSNDVLVSMIKTKQSR